MRRKALKKRARTNRLKSLGKTPEDHSPTSEKKISKRLKTVHSLGSLRPKKKLARKGLKQKGPLKNVPSTEKRKAPIGNSIHKQKPNPPLFPAETSRKKKKNEGPSYSGGATRGQSHFFRGAFNTNHQTTKKASSNKNGLQSNIGKALHLIGNNLNN